MKNKVLVFKSSFDKVIERGLPSFWDGNNDLIPLEAYKDYGVLFDPKHIFDDLGAPSYDDHAELEMMMRNAWDHKYPLGKEWGDMMIQIKKDLAEIQESQHFFLNQRKRRQHIILNPFNRLPSSRELPGNASSDINISEFVPAGPFSTTF